MESDHDKEHFVKMEILIPDNNVEKLKSFLQENKGKVISQCLHLPLNTDEIANTGQEKTGATTSILLQQPLECLNTKELSAKTLILLMRNNIPISQFAFHILNRSQGRGWEILRQPKPFEKLTEDGREPYRAIKNWLDSKDPIGELRSKLKFKRKRAPGSSPTSNRTKFTHIQRMALESLFKESKYPSQGALEDFSKVNDLDYKTVKIWFNNRRQRCNKEENCPIDKICRSEM